jgi:hypothetical protein
MWLGSKRGYLQDWITQVWVKATGKQFNEKDVHWLLSPIGKTDKIADSYIDELIKKNGYVLKKNEPGLGLMESFDRWNLSNVENTLLNKRIRHFYEHTYDYHFEFWSKWVGIFYPGGWLLSKIFSKRLQQLNLPLNSMTASKGLESNIIKLLKGTNVVHTIWFRKLYATKDVIYSGIYATCKAPDGSTKLKVSFPLPNGAATVIMRKEVCNDGSLKIISDGKKHGDCGFYFTLTDGDGKWWIRFVRSMHEYIHVYENDLKELRADHVLFFWGLRFIKLHYKMTLKN